MGSSASTEVITAANPRVDYAMNVAGKEKKVRT
jgi:hypothetical protein